MAAMGMKDLIKRFVVEKKWDLEKRLYLCGWNKLPSKQISRQFSGFYKGIPWRIVVKGDMNDTKSKIYFSARLFKHILAVRIMLKPFLKRLYIEDGCWMVTGAAFSHGEKLFILFGPSGTRKTRYCLQSMEAGATYICDDHLLITPTGELTCAYNFISLGFNTIKGTRLWPVLSLMEKLKIIFFYVVSILTLKKINFGLLVNFEKIGSIKGKDHRGKKIIFIDLKNVDRIHSISLEETVAAFYDYEKNYQRLYGNFFPLHNYKEDMSKVISSFFSTASRWRVPVGTHLSEILSLE